MPKTPKRPRDPNQLAALIVGISIGEIEEKPTSSRAKAGRSGGLKGGSARAKTLTADQRADIARLAAEARWKKKGA